VADMKSIKGSKLEDGHHHEDHHNLFSRKDFIKRLGLFSAGSALALGGTPVQALHSSSLFNKIARLESNKVLVLIQLRGGNDGLNTIIPYENDFYYQYRSDGLSISKSDAIKLSDTMGMNSEMKSLTTLWEEGKMSIIQSVGYEKNNMSHFKSTDIWMNGNHNDQVISSGWIGRYNELENPNFIIDPPKVPLAIQIGGISSLLFKGRVSDMGMTMSSIDRFENIAKNGEVHSLDGIPSTFYGDEMKYLRKKANDSFRYAESIQRSYELGNKGKHNVPYPENSPFTKSLSIISKLIKGDLGTKIYLVTLKGFDTHSNQNKRHPKLLKELSDAVMSFYADLAANNKSEEVIIATFSEFGRRVKSNGSGGTDHGSAAPLFVFGDSVNGGFIGNDPLLEPENLDKHYNLVPEYDFRQVYRTLLTDWFGLDESEASATLGNEFEKIPFLNTSTPVSTGNSE
jgi:uncharacterized protein (DUF1501 family)